MPSALSVVCNVRVAPPKSDRRKNSQGGKSASSGKACCLTFFAAPDVDETRKRKQAFPEPAPQRNPSILYTTRGGLRSSRRYRGLRRDDAAASVDGERRSGWGGGGGGSRWWRRGCTVVGKEELGGASGLRGREIETPLGHHSTLAKRRSTQRIRGAHGHHLYALLSPLPDSLRAVQSTAMWVRVDPRLQDECPFPPQSPMRCTTHDKRRHGDGERAGRGVAEFACTRRSAAQVASHRNEEQAHAAPVRRRERGLGDRTRKAISLAINLGREGNLGTICWRDAKGEESRQVLRAAPFAAGGAQWKRREREAPQAKLAPRVVDLAPMMRSGS
ncbi:hypothetical protein B0H13DRAFT_1875002 [Mycena leptocephala]|nr:hypothetical protein B0H13DRAFT_1875002 [Mycena leptocephala]